MSLTTIVGALLALAGRPKQEQAKEEREAEHLRRSHARLIDHIERLERELSLARELLAHWRGEAARLARDNRERRAYQPQLDPRQALAGAQANALARYAQAQQAQQSVYQGFCNCVPSRSQVWGRKPRAQQLNDNTIKE